MIYLIIGPSCSGKTQIVTNSFIKNSCEIVCYKDIIKVTKTDDAYLIGDYTVDKKVRGTDRISRNQLKLIAPQIIKLFKSDTQKDIVAEGVNICWSFVFDELLLYRKDIKLIYLYCTKDVSLNRNHTIGSTASDSWFKSIWTRTDNIFNKYCNDFDSYIIYTNEDMDFSKISLTTADIEQFTGSRIKKRRKLF